MIRKVAEWRMAPQAAIDGRTVPLVLELRRRGGPVLVQIAVPPVDRVTDLLVGGHDETPEELKVETTSHVLLREDQIVAAIASLPDEESRRRVSGLGEEPWRRLLWLRHGCPISALYGDDGEMQCGDCIIDFKRMSASEVGTMWARKNLVTLTEPAAMRREVGRESAIREASGQLPRPAWQIAAIAREIGSRFFMGLPDRWMESPTWRCKNDHVSKRFLKSEEKGDLCLACGESVNLTFPEDKEGPCSTST